MPPMTKITVEQEGEPSVTLHIDPAAAPVSLGDLLKRAKALREEAAAANAPAANAPDQMVANVTHLRAVAERLRNDGPGPFITVYHDERPAVLAALEMAISGPFSAPTYEFTGYGSEIFRGPVISDPESDLEDVLDSYRLAGRLCGVQVFAVDHVLCWIGDIEQAQGYTILRLRNPGSPPPVFHTTIGADALEGAAKWLREQLSSKPPHGVGMGSSRPHAPSSGEIGR